MCMPEQSMHNMQGSRASVWAATHVGKVRTINEDSYRIPQGGEGKLFILADGMGGHNAGEVASRIACDIAMQAFLLREQVPLAERAYQAVFEANLAIFDAMTENQEFSGMGTTITLAGLDDEQAVIAQVGDSRAYLIKQGEISQITHDHSLVQELLRAGRIDASEAATHPYRHVITRALGTSPVVDIDIFRVPLEKGMIMVLCSDGLTDHVGDACIKSLVMDALNEGRDPALCLAEEAVARGGSDNVTVIVIRMEEAKGGCES